MSMVSCSLDIYSLAENEYREWKVSGVWNRHSPPDERRRSIVSKMVFCTGGGLCCNTMIE